MSSAVFLSASVPVPGRGDYHESANPFLIQCAVRELVIAVIRSGTLVWGGHPAVTPMIWTVCEDLGVDYGNSVVLYQSLHFRELFPAENARFRNVVFVEAVPGNREDSLRRMREEMLSRQDLCAAVFIGGMQGIEVEYDLFRSKHRRGAIILVPSAGGAALQLALKVGGYSNRMLEDVDFARLFHSRLVPLLRSGKP